MVFNKIKNTMDIWILTILRYQSNLQANMDGDILTNFTINSVAEEKIKLISENQNSELFFSRDFKYKQSKNVDLLSIVFTQLLIKLFNILSWD